MKTSGRDPTDTTPNARRTAHEITVSANFGGRGGECLRLERMMPSWTNLDCRIIAAFGRQQVFGAERVQRS